MLHQPIRGDYETIELVDELDRARRLVLALNNPSDRLIIERYIAELEAQQVPGSLLSIPTH